MTSLTYTQDDDFEFLKGFININDDGHTVIEQEGVTLLFNQMGLDFRVIAKELTYPQSEITQILTSPVEGYNYNFGSIQTLLEDGLSDKFIADIIDYLGVYEGDKRARELRRKFNELAIRKIAHDIKGWKPKTSHEIRALMASQVSLVALPWEKRFDELFWEALRKLYGLERGQLACARVISAYIYGWFPDEVRDKLNEVNPLTEEGYRKKKLHQHFQDEILIMLESHIRRVTLLMFKSHTVFEFKKKMRDIPKFGNEKKLLKSS